jgi:hypothetical protein
MVLTAAAVVFKLDAYAEIFTEWLGFLHITTLEFSPDDGFSFSICFSSYPSNSSSFGFHEGWVFPILHQQL